MTSKKISPDCDRTEWQYGWHKINRWTRERLKKITIYRVSVWVAFIGLLVWTCVNVAPLIRRYSSGETRISIDNELPRIFNFPGVTFCSASIFRPRKLAELFPKFKKSFDQFMRTDKSVRETLDKKFPYRIEQRNKLYNKFEAKALDQFPVAEVISLHSVRLIEMIDWCRFRPFNMRTIYHNHVNISSVNCDLMRPILESIYEGRKCFTYFSNIFDLRFLSFYPDLASGKYNNGDNEKKIWKHLEDMLLNSPQLLEHNFDLLNLTNLRQMLYFLNPDIALQIKLGDDWDYLPNSYPMMTIHPANGMANKLDYSFFTIYKNTFYDVTFTKKVVNMLKKPYKTACVDPQDDGYAGGFRTSQECLNTCIKDRIFKVNSCVNHFSPLTEMMFLKPDERNTRICTENQNYSKYLEEKEFCELNRCFPECVQSIYEIAGTMVTYLDENCESIMTPLFTNQTESSKKYDEKAAWFGNDSMRQDAIYDDKDDDNSDNRHCKTQVSIKISPNPYQVITHKPALTQEEYIGIIGGHIGIWLGLSIFALINFIVHFVINLLKKFFKTSVGRERFDRIWN